MLVCLDGLRKNRYTGRIWCVFECYVACQNDIPVEVLLPGDEDIDSLRDISDLFAACRVDVASATASRPEDEIAIKQEIGHKVDDVNQLVEYGMLKAVRCHVASTNISRLTSFSSRNGYGYTVPRANWPQ